MALAKIEEMKTYGQICRGFEALREPVGEFMYLSLLEKYGVRSPEQFRDIEKARDCYREMKALAKAVA